jgi:predicted metalloendopeptidase
LALRLRASSCDHGCAAHYQIGHAFDDAGSQYDASGALRDWWTPADRAQYQDKAQCFANQYSQLTVDVGNGQSGRVDGRITLGENIADNTGIVQTLRAFLRYAMQA